MGTPSEIAASAVIRAIYDLHERTGEWPTSKAIAGHLETDERTVRRHLLQLRRDRLMQSRARGRTVWMPWGRS